MILKIEDTKPIFTLQIIFNNYSFNWKEVPIFHC